MSEIPTKPLGRKAYGSIGHLPMSRMGPGDHACPDGYATICCVKPRDKHDRIIETSQYEQHQLFHRWVLDNWQRFDDVLTEGERIVGEWLAQAHGTRYDLWHEPFIPFDIMVADKRLTFDAFRERVAAKFTLPYLLGDEKPLCVEDALAHAQQRNYHGALDPIEGVVYRVERQGRVDFLAKFVRPDKVDGAYLAEVSGKEAVWNWRPK
jgi:hypothetical protein